MSWKRLLIAGAIGFGLGVLATLALWSPVGDGEPGTKVAQPAPPPAPTAKSSVSADVGATAGEEPPQTAPSTPAPRSREPVFDTPAVGTGVVSGTVTDEDGEPLADVLVRSGSHDRSAWRRPADPSRPPPRPSAEERLREMEKLVRWEHAVARETRTDAQGRFRLERLPDREHYVSLWAEGYTFRRAPGQSGPIRPGADLRYVGTSVRIVSVRVLHVDGSLAEEADLQYRPTDSKRGGRGHRWHPEATRMQIPPGKWTVSLREDRRAEFVAEPVEIVVPAVGTPPSVDLWLVERNRVEGRVFPADAGEWDYLWVWLKPLAPGADPEAAALPMTDPRAGARPPDFHFRLDDVEPGRYVIAASPDSRTVEGFQVVDVVPGLTRVELRMGAVDPSKRLTMQVFGPGGDLIEDARIALVESHGNGRSETGVRSTRREDGSYAIYFGGGTGSGVREDARYALRITSEGLGAQEVAVRPGIDTQLEVRFVEPARAVVSLPGYPEAYPETGLTVALVPRGAGAFASSLALHRDALKLTPKGWESGPLPPGEYELVLHTGSGHGWDLARIPMTLGGGINERTVTAPALATLVISFDAAQAGSRVHLTPGRRPGGNYATRSAVVDDAGRARFGHLPDGPYVLSHGDSATRGEMLIRIPAEANVTFRAMRFEGLEIVDIESGGFLDRAGFRRGDVMTSIRGEEPTSFAQAASRLSHGPGSRTYPIVVSRGGSAVEIQVESARMDGWQGVGGHWEPLLR